MSDNIGDGVLGGGIGVDEQVREVLTYCKSNVLSPFDEGQVVMPDNGESVMLIVSIFDSTWN